MSTRRCLLAAIAAALALALAATAACGRREPPVSAAEVVALRMAVIPEDPEDPAWREAPVHPAGLLLQDLVEPRLMTPSTPEVRVQAITDGARVAFRMEWPDETRDDLPGPARFSDACAVQLPMKIESDLPAPQMGEIGRRVEIAYWKASWQAVIDGRGDEIQALYPGASVDHYPFQAEPLKDSPEAQREEALLYAPARALGNLMEGPRERPVEDLIAEGPGSLNPAPQTRSTAHGRRGEKGWSVVIARPAPEGLAPGGRTQVAFAVWQGAADEVGARKMRTGWIPLALGAEK